MTVSIRDIARHTGLSVGTVSRALKNQEGLTEATRVRVSEAAHAMGYDFSRLKQGKIRRIVFLLHRQHAGDSAAQFFSPVLQGAESACREAGIALSLVTSAPSEPLLEQIRLHQADAIICAGYVEPDILSALRHTNKPMVLLDARQSGFDSVCPDHRLGGFLATRHLIQQGRQRIAMLSGSLAHFSIAERARGFRQALFENKMLADPQLEISLDTMHDLTAGVGNAMDVLMHLPHPPDALFCYNDITALEVLKYCHAHGIKVPAQLAVIGFDDIAPAAQAMPPLSSIGIDKQALGMAGVALLLNHTPSIGSPERAVTEHIEPVRLIVRESSCDD